MTVKSLGEKYMEAILRKDRVATESVDVCFTNEKGEKEIESITGADCGWYQDEETGTYVAGSEIETLVFPSDRVIYIRYRHSDFSKKKVVKKPAKKRAAR